MPLKFGKHSLQRKETHNRYASLNKIKSYMLYVNVNANEIKC